MSNFKSMSARHIDGARRTPRSPLGRGNQNQKFVQFKVDHPRVWEWLQYSNGNFSFSLKQRLQRTGELTQGQIDKVNEIIAGEELKKVQQQVKVEQQNALAPNVGDGAVKIIQVFKRAREQGLKKPSLLTEAFEFSYAPEHGRNPGWLYVTNRTDSAYRGKIDPEGRYHGNMQGDELGLLKKVMENPMEEAINFGKRFGICSCCGRELSNPESVELGIGPICRTKFFG